MRPALLLCLALIWFGATPATAGAWMQEHGKGFLSFSGVYSQTRALDGALFLEYGLRPRLTLGAKVDMDMTYGRMGDGTAFVFMRKPIGSPARTATGHSPTGQTRPSSMQPLALPSTTGSRS